MLVDKEILLEHAKAERIGNEYFWVGLLPGKPFTVLQPIGTPGR